MTQTDSQETSGGGTGVDARVARHGGLSYLKIPAVEPRRSAAFYEQVLGWNVQERGADDFRFEDVTGHLIGRWVMDHMISREPGLLPYFYVERIDDAGCASRFCGVANKDNRRLEEKDRGNSTDDRSKGEPDGS